TVRYNPENVSVSEGELEIITQPGDINNDNPASPENFILQSAPEGDFTIETRFQAPLAQRWQYAGLLAYGDDDNYVKLDVVARNQPGQELVLGGELVSEIDGSFGAGGTEAVDLPAEPEDGYWHLRLSRTGEEYQGWVSQDGQDWTSLGEPVTNAGELSSFGLVAIGPEQAEPTTVSFDYLRVVDGGTEPPADEDAPTVSGNVLGTSTAAFAPTGRGDLEIEGTATLTKSDSGTAVQVRASGLEAGESYPSHLHDGSCSDHGGHYMDDPDGPHAPPNEIWASSTSDPEGDLIANDEGVAVGSGSADWIARQQPLSIMIHEPELPGLPIACAELSSYTAPATLVLAADDGEGSGVELLEYVFDDGDWQPYSEEVTVTEPGDHTVSFRATDAAGNFSDVGELIFAVAGDEPGDPGEPGELVAALV